MKKAKKSLNKFGEFVSKNLRDRSIFYFDKLCEGHWKAPKLLKLQNELKGFNKDKLEIIRRCIIDVITVGMHDFLFALQEETESQEESGLEAEIKVMVDGINIAEVSDGLHGEIFGEDGWFAKYSDYGEPPEEA